MVRNVSDTRRPRIIRTPSLTSDRRAGIACVQLLRAGPALQLTAPLTGIKEVGKRGFLRRGDPVGDETGTEWEDYAGCLTSCNRHLCVPRKG